MSKIVYDAPWFSRLKQASILDANWLTIHAHVVTEERTRFLENEIENPVFDVLPDAQMEFSTARRFWNDFRDDLQSTEKNPIIRELYEEKIIAQLERVELLEASEMKDDERFLEASRAIYGIPKKRFFKYIAKRMQELIAASDGSAHTGAVKRLDRIFRKIDTNGVLFTPELLPFPRDPGDRLEDPVDVVSVFQDVLEAHEVTGWEVRIDDTLKRRVFSVNVVEQVINVPSAEHLQLRRKPLTRVGVQALAEHEIGVHVVRSFRGRQQPLKLLAVGLRGYLRGEEGVASYRQQLIEGADEYYGFERYLAASLVIGLDGVQRDFRALFEVMQDYYLLTLPDAPDSMDRARNGAWDTCLRMFRGTTGQCTGVCYTKDISYLEGNIGIWKLLTNEPRWDEYLTLGKYDPLNGGHVDALRALEILQI